MSGRTCAWCSETATRGTFCEKHWEVNRENNRKKSEKKKASGQCWRCDKPPAPGKKLCDEHLERAREEAAEQRRKKKLLPDCPHCRGTGKLASPEE
jgi:Zn finger protein HypA/HybF involved in hydrogenase expression